MLRVSVLRHRVHCFRFGHVAPFASFPPHAGLSPEYRGEGKESETHGAHTVLVGSFWSPAVFRRCKKHKYRQVFGDVIKAMLDPSADADYGSRPH
jgi:hypothetical protein